MGKFLPALTLLVSLYEFYKSLPKRIRTSYDPHCINLITIVVRYLHRPQSLSKGGGGGGGKREKILCWGNDITATDLYR